MSKARRLKLTLRTTLFVGLLVREVFSFWTGHPFDFELWVRTGFWVTHGVSPYGVLQQVPGLSFSNIFSAAGESTIGYLPFWPVLLGGIYQLYTLIGFGSEYVYYFLLKQPVIIADVLLGYLILVFVKTKRPEASNAVMFYWLFSPYTIIISGVWGMFDSLAMLPVIAALLTSRGSYRSSLDGIATWVKSIPLIFAVPFALSGKNKFTNLVVSIAIPTFGSLGIILLAGWPFTAAVDTLNSTVGKGGQSLSLIGVFYYLTQLDSATSWQPLLLTIAGNLWIPAELVTILLAYRRLGFSTTKGLVGSLILCTITFMLFKAQVNEQYAVYLLSLTLIDVAIWNPSRKWLYLAITASVMAYLVVNNVFLVRFLAPIYPGWNQFDMSMIERMGQLRPDFLQVCSLVFDALNIYYFRIIFQDSKQSLK